MAWWNDRNATALHYALVNDRIDEVRRLIAGGADVNKPDSTGRRPLDFSTVLDPCDESPQDSEWHDQLSRCVLYFLVMFRGSRDEATEGGDTAGQWRGS